MLSQKSSTSTKDAAFIAKALGGSKVGSGYVARCPAHDDQTPSLSICDAGDRVLVHCHAGCEQTAVIETLKKRGLWNAKSHSPRRRLVRSRATETQPTEQSDARTATALKVWRSAVPPGNTLVELYLKGRGITLPIPPSLSFHPGLKHRSGSLWPSMVALVTAGTDNTPLAIHRTFLARDGSGKAPVNPTKMMLGPCKGGAVRLGEPAGVLMIGEGIETCLAAMQATGNPAWAALSTSGLRSLDLPEDVRDVIVLADGDDPGEAAAQDCAQRWKSEGRRVRIARPGLGLDFNDLLLGRAPRDREHAA